jgi:hypothetical protein
MTEKGHLTCDAGPSGMHFGQIPDLDGVISRAGEEPIELAVQVQAPDHF